MYILIYIHIYSDMYTYRQSFRGGEGLTIPPRPLHDNHRLSFRPCSYGKGLVRVGQGLSDAKPP